MDRQKEERERGVTISCTTKEFFTEKWHYTIIDAPGAAAARGWRAAAGCCSLLRASGRFWPLQAAGRSLRHCAAVALPHPRLSR